MQSFLWQGFKIEVRRRAFQRTLSLRVPAPGLIRVSCARKLSIETILKFIEEKKDFVEARQIEWRTHLSKALVKNFESGEICPFLGQPRTLQVIEKKGRSKAELKSDRILVHVEDPKPEEVQKALIRFYQKSGKNYLSHLTKIQSERMGLYPKALSFRSQKTRWGSCSSQGKISLNWRLVAAPSHIAEYVVIHELAHLKHQDHSKNFWRLVEQFSPDYRDHKAWLKKHQIQFEFLDPSYIALGEFFSSTKISDGTWDAASASSI